MADIELVIKIPEEKYQEVVNGRWGNGLLGVLCAGVANGTPLPKGPGRLMILSEDKLKENQIKLDSSCQNWICEIGLSNATVTIIEADRKEQK